MLMAIDKFTKWIEYKPIATLNADRVVTFICDILQLFGFPNTIIIDLGSNFHSHQIWDSMNAAPLNSNMSRWPTRGPMVRLSAPMA
jgi:hypothetical protein